jgi:transposase-like protein
MNRTHNPLIAMNRNERSVYSVFSDRIEAYSVIELTEIHVFPTDDSLLKMLYLAMVDITKKWTGRRQDWSIIYAQLSVFFADRMPVE